MTFSMIRFINADRSTKPGKLWVGTKIAQIDNKPTARDLMAMVVSHHDHERVSILVSEGSAKHNPKDKFDRKLGVQIATERLIDFAYELVHFNIDTDGIDMTFHSREGNVVSFSSDGDKVEVFFSYVEA